VSYEDIQTASVIRYPYLWAREAEHGETEGRKNRPVAVGVRLPRPDGDLVLFFPITTKQPEASRFAAEIPAMEKRRAGLNEISGFGSSSTSTTPISSVSPSISNLIHRSAASAKRSFFRWCVSSSPGENP